MAVTFGSAGAVSTPGSGTTASIAVPSGVVTNSGIVVFVYVEDGTEAVTPPSGFAEAPSSPAAEGGGFPNRTVLHVYGKRQTSATGAGETTGNYTFTIAAGLAWQYGYAIRFSGCGTSGSLFDIDAIAQGNQASTVVNVGPVTTTVADTMLLWGVSLFDDNRNPTVPTGGWTTIVNAGNYRAAYKAQAATGSSGAVGGATIVTGSTGQAVWLGALKPVAAAVKPTGVVREGLSVAVRRAGFY